MLGAGGGGVEKIIIFLYTTNGRVVREYVYPIFQQGIGLLFCYSHRVSDLIFQTFVTFILFLFLLFSRSHTYKFIIRVGLPFNGVNRDLGLFH